MIVVEDLKKGDEAMFSNCGLHCEEQFIFKALEKKKQITIVCPVCNSTTVIRHMANGSLNRKWFKGDKDEAK